jgi:23S rRNA (cytidine1920-2'-O)/16S rRNA (cytidine1409-2'-O)-methyltransferase
VTNRHEAQQAIAAGLVLVAGTQADKAARQVAPDEPIVLQGPPPPFVSRGGQKLDAALTRFAVAPKDRRALDAGASTGGFTDCLLQRGAAHVYAVDVGHGQLDQRLRLDQRVTVLERANVRVLTPEILRQADPAFEPCSLITADLSFISLVTVVPILCGPIGLPTADLVLLVKPQFEAGRAVVAKGKGVVRDPEVWRSTLERVTSALADAGTGIMGVMVSPLTGPAGNVEFLVHAQKASALGRASAHPQDVGRLISAAVGEAASRRTAPDGTPGDAASGDAASVGATPVKGGNDPD